MADARRREPAQRSATLLETWRRLNLEQRVAAVGAVLLIVSTFGPFSLVEAAIVLTAGGVLALLKKRADGRPFHLPFGDGTVIFVAGLWSALLIVVRLFDKSLGQSILALACAAILAAAGARERAKRPPDDLPVRREPGPSPARRGAADSPARPRAASSPAHREPSAARREPAAAPGDEVTEKLAPEDAPTERGTARDTPSELDRRP